MWATVFHLLVGNLFIGLLEGLLIAYLFRLAKWPAVRIFIGANYFSAFAGGFILPYFWDVSTGLFLSGNLLYRIPLLLILMWAFSWLLSVLLEWPFCYWALRWQKGTTVPGKQTLLHRALSQQTAGSAPPKVDSADPTRKRLKRALKASLIAQTASYLLLTPYFFYASNLSLYNEARLQRSLSFVHQAAATVYYMNGEDGAIWSIKTDGTGRTLVPTPRNADDGFLILKPDHTPGQCSLYQVVYPGGAYQQDAKPLYETLLAAHLRGRCAPATEEPEYAEKVLDLRQGADHEWSVRSGRYAWGALSVTQHNHRTYRLGMETPFFHWSCGFTTILPGDQAVFMAGHTSEDAEILILDLKSRQLGPLALGRSPVVLLTPVK